MNIAIQINKQTLMALPEGPLVAASVGVVTCTAEFDPSWDGFGRTLVFTGAGQSRSVLWTDGTMTVPWEVLAEPGPLYISALGVREGQQQPTAVMEEPLSIRPSGPLAGEAPEEYTDALWSQTLAQVQQLRDEAIRAAEAAEALAERFGATVGGTAEPVEWADIRKPPLAFSPNVRLFLRDIPDDSSFSGQYLTIGDAFGGEDPPFIEGEPYYVTWNGEPYLCTYRGGTYNGVLGNHSLVDAAKPNTREPFAMVIANEDMLLFGYHGTAVTLDIFEPSITKKLSGALVQNMPRPVDKTEEMTQPVGMDELGKLWVELPAVEIPTYEDLDEVGY